VKNYCRQGTYFILMSIVIITMAACQTMGEKETIGSVAGGVIGGLAGSQIGKGKGKLMATAAGSVLGYILGKEVGATLDKVDQLHAEQTANEALESNPTGKTSSWSNPDSGNSGTITPMQTSYLTSGEPCREYQQTITVNSETQQTTGKACRNENGIWYILN